MAFFCLIRLGGHRKEGGKEEATSTFPLPNTSVAGLFLHKGIFRRGPAQTFLFRSAPESEKKSVHDKPRPPLCFSLIFFVSTETERVQLSYFL